MQGLMFRLGALALVLLLGWALVWVVQRFIAAERKRAFAAAGASSPLSASEQFSAASVRILAFSSETCRPCHTLQRPALEEIAARHGDSVAISWIDAPSSPDLAERYHVLTVPTTVVLDAENHVHAVNYGFAPTYRLQEQITAVLGPR
jgi:thioredoxin-like negative regulator of GroEL